MHQCFNSVHNVLRLATGIPIARRRQATTLLNDCPVLGSMKQQQAQPWWVSKGSLEHPEWVPHREGRGKMVRVLDIRRADLLVSGCDAGRQWFRMSEKTGKQP